MTYDEALQKLHEMFPADLVSIRYERSIHPSGSDASDSPAISVYTSSTGWHFPRSSFAGAINGVNEKKDKAPKINDGKEGTDGVDFGPETDD